MKEKKIVVIDGQGRRIGRLLIEQLKAAELTVPHEIFAIGTNSTATAADSSTARVTLIQTRGLTPASDTSSVRVKPQSLQVYRVVPSSWSSPSSQM